MTAVACEHSSQIYEDTVWVCSVCGDEIEKDVFDKDKILSIRLNGLGALKQQREMGKTEREMTKQNLEMYKKKNPHKDPVREDGKDRWI